MSNNPHFMNMTADTLGKSLLQGLIQEIRIMPDCWQKLPEAKQQDIIDRLERQVRNAATIAVHTIAGGDRDTVYGKLESMTAKDKMKAVFVVNPSSPHKEDLLFAVNKDCLLIIGGANEFTEGMDQVKPDPDQNPLDLNGGDHDMEDAGAWGGMQPADDSDVGDAEFQELPQLTVERFAGHTLARSPSASPPRRTCSTRPGCNRASLSPPRKPSASFSNCWTRESSCSSRKTRSPAS
ncbi:cell division protein FtsK [Pseudomonas aeruginosa]|uniref:cell division protein FtsK n=1 Tax=Pseudomonas aeruginosa TaxID=287 RepID=UPI000A6A873C|nr:cell division protein FtsK [Pseudomonas aeruginosa]